MEPADPLVRPQPLAALVGSALAGLARGPTDLGAAASHLVHGVAQAHDRVERGGIFVARKGARADGHDVIGDAVAAGAIAVVGERTTGATSVAGVPYIAVSDAKAATARLAAALYDHPSRKLTVLGVTGTDGKTTTSTMLHHVLGDGAGLISTARIASGPDRLDLEGRFTTPEAPQIQALLARFVADGRRFAVVESSSHGLAQRRLDAIRYDVAVVTTFTPEHLDFHGSVASYLAAKQTLVRRAPVAVLDRGLEVFEAFASVVGTDLPDDVRTPPRVVTYGRDRDAAFRVSSVEAAPTGVSFTLEPPSDAGPLDVHVPMPGAFNASNAAAAIAAAAQVGVAPSEAAARLATLPGVPGRMQPVQRDPFAVVVDFAHTPEALATVLDALREGVDGRLIVVIGAAGERDPGKRAPLGATAVTRGDVAIFTEEDTRSERIEAILETMAEGARGVGGREGFDFERVPDRRAAIRRAIGLARPGDVVVLAGKGHEATLERSDGVLSWDEAGEAAAALRERFGAG